MKKSNIQKIGGYNLAEEIGSGTFSVVYRAYQPQLERWVAIKVLHSEADQGRKFLRRFRREARAIAALRHPNISTVYDYGEEGGVAYIVMEYVPGGSLSDRMRAPMVYTEALKIVIAVGEALAYAHSQGIVHRDVKPANILLPRPDWPLLTDFGLAQIVGAQKKLTQPGAVIGSAMYLSPEQVLGNETDQRTDIYSLGMVLYQLVTGKSPFSAQSSVDSILARVYDPPKPPRSLNPDLPSSLEVVILRALERDVGSRYASMESFVNDLRQVTQRFPPSTDSEAEIPSASPMITTRLGAREAVTGPQLFIATSGIALPIPEGEEIVIGRRVPRQSKPPDLDLEPYGGGASGMSRYHARLLKRAEGWFLEDMQSTNGSYVNEVRLLPHRPIRLHSGDIIRFGQFTLVFNEA